MVIYLNIESSQPKLDVTINLTVNRFGSMYRFTGSTPKEVLPSPKLQAFLKFPFIMLDLFVNFTLLPLKQKPESKVEKSATG